MSKRRKIISAILLIVLLGGGLWYYHQWRQSFLLPPQVQTDGTILSHPNNAIGNTLDLPLDEL